MGIVFINGPFGVGKSTVAELLAQQMPETVLFDPETIGTYLAHTLGREALGDDYQDLPLWRHLFVDIALRLQQDWRPNLVIPMNLWRHDYFSEIVIGLRRNGTRVSGFRLTCSPDTLRARILARPDADGATTGACRTSNRVWRRPTIPASASPSIRRARRHNLSPIVSSTLREHVTVYQPG